MGSRMLLRQNSFFDLIKDGIVHGQRLALNSNFWNFAKESPKCDLLLILESQTDENREQSKAVAIWLVELLRKFAPQLSVRVKFHRLTSSYALYLSASYLSLLKGAELCHLKKPVKTCFGGGMRDFSVDCAHFFRDIENKDAFFSEMERSLIVKQIIEIIRSPHGGLCLTTSPLSSNSKSGEGVSSRGYVTELSKLNTSVSDNVVLDIPEGRTVFSTLYSTGIVKSVFPLHNTERLKKLESSWVYSLSFNQPIEEIKEYFGTEVALYFAWLSHLITSLWIPATIGVLMFVFGRSSFNLSDDFLEDNSLTTDICFAIFAIFNCIWSSAYLELWKRKQAELAFQWGTYEICTDNSLINDIRSAFKGDKIVRNPVSGRMEPDYTPWKHALIRYGLTYPATIFCIILVFIFLFLMLQIQQFAELHFKTSYFMKWIIYVPMIIQSIIILIADHVYRNLALYFNDLENYRTDEEYENFLISKIATFQCVNAFGSLFYIAFYLNDSTRLQETLATLLISRQVIQNVVEIAAPFVKEKFRLFRLTNKLMRCLSDNSLKKKVDEIRDRSDKTGPHLNSESFSKSLDVETFEKNALFSWGELRLRRVFDTTLEANSSKHKLTGEYHSGEYHSERLPIPEFCPGDSDLFEVSTAELQSMMTKYLRPLDDYLEMFIQFGYVVLFSPAFPLAAMCLLVNVVVEMRVDAFKLFSFILLGYFVVQKDTMNTGNTLQRPFGRRVRSIGAWQTAMQLMGILGVFVNCALISNSGLVQRLWPDLSLNGQLLLIVVLEHSIFIMRMLIDYLIPDVPYWIRVKAAKVEHWRREAYKNDLKFSSTCSSPAAESRTPAKTYSRNHYSGTEFSAFEKSRPDSPLLPNNTNTSNIFCLHYKV